LTVVPVRCRYRLMMEVSLLNYVWIGIAGIAGTGLRHVLGVWARALFPQTSFPVGTLAVNLIGCFVLGWFAQLVLAKSRISHQVRLAISTGLIGSFTTFSTFSVETVQLIQGGMLGAGIAYAGVSLIGGLLLVWLGAASGIGKSGGRPTEGTTVDASAGEPVKLDERAPVHDGGAVEHVGQSVIHDERSIKHDGRAILKHEGRAIQGGGKDG